MKAIKVIAGKTLKFFVMAGVMMLVSNGVKAQKPAGPPWLAPASAIAVRNPVAVNPTSIKDGKEIYIKNCKSCHGDAGKGDGTKAGNLDISCGDFGTAAFAAKKDGELYWKITEGRKPMPTFAKKLTDNERWSVVNYMRTFKR